MAALCLSQWRVIKVSLARLGCTQLHRPEDVQAEAAQRTESPYVMVQDNSSI
jgi:hypothetical protein